MEVTQELVQSLFTYKDGILYWKVERSNGINIGDEAGTLHKVRTGYRRRVGINRKYYYSARIIFLFHKGYLPEQVDHEDNDMLNDRIENLRPATGLQNAKNRSSSKGSTSRYLGVWLQKGRGSRTFWRSKIKVGSKQKSLGCFKVEEDAALAYNRAAVLYHGEFANLNIIQRILA